MVLFVNIILTRSFHRVDCNNAYHELTIYIDLYFILKISGNVLKFILSFGVSEYGLFPQTHLEMPKSKRQKIKLW